jgi:lysozyme
MSAVDIATALIHKWEGCSLRSYPDPATGAAPWTIGYGATGPAITEGTVWTQSQADNDLETRIAALSKTITNESSYMMDDNQEGACISLAYNIGINAFLQSTLFRDWNAGNAEEAADQFLVWNKAAGKVNQGLVNRRADERRVFLGGSPE